MPWIPLDWMLREGSMPLFKKTMAETESMGFSFTSRVKALKAYREEFDITEQKHFPNATWSDYFAILAIAYVLEALNPANFLEPDKQDSETYRFSNLEWPLECMEAVCAAECYDELDRYAKKQQADVKERGRKGGRTRVAKFEALKEKVINYYLDNNLQSRSNRDAAKRIYSALQDEVDTTLSTEDPILRLASWIGKHKKEMATKISG